MKLFRFGAPGAEKPGVMRGDVSDDRDAGDARIDASGFFPSGTDGRDWDERFFGTDGLDRLSAWLKAEGSRAPRVPAGARLGPAIARPSKLVCIGLNYRDHARESGATPPKEPIVFLKAPSAIAGPHDDLVLPLGGDKTDWEVELALVIGRRAKYVEPESALDHVAGFVLHNDYSERAFQLERLGQWTKGKSADGFAPLGPYFVTRDEFLDFGAVRLWLKVNGEIQQNGNSADMIFDVPTLVSYVSRFMTLEPGDLLSTGTPAGVGMGHKPPVYLRPGDLVEYGIDGLGEAHQRVVGAPQV